MAYTTVTCNFCCKNNSIWTDYKTLHNTIQLCSGCSSSGKKVVDFLTEMGHDHRRPSFPQNANTYEKVTKWFEFFADAITELRKKVEFLESPFSQLRKETPPDIYLKPGDDQPCLPAHVIILAARSEVLKNVVGVDDGLKSAASRDTILTFPELNGEELESLVEFLYTGSVSKEMMNKHAYSLLIAADKYDIPYLLQVCQTHIMQSVIPGDKRDKLLDKCSKFLRDNMSSPLVLSSQSPPQLLELLMKTYASGAVGVLL